MATTIFLRVFFFVLIVGLSLHVPAQTKPQQKAPSQKEMQDMMKQAQQMMDEAMKDLSPEEKKMMQEGMKQVQEMQAAGKLAAGPSTTKTPAKQTALLANIPKLLTAAQYDDYLSGLKLKATKRIDKKIQDETEATIRSHGTNTAAQLNLAPALLLQKKPKAAVYAAIRIAQLGSNIKLSQSNLAVILHQCGYPQYALPILEYLLLQSKNALFYNNAAQCYLSLGETEKAKQYFAACLRINPAHPEANAGTALILVNEGRTAEATPHISKALKNGFSETVAKLAEDKKIKLGYDQLKCKVPEYFNPNKYKPAPAAQKMEEVKQVLTQREEIRALMTAWQEKEEEVNRDQEGKTEKENLSQTAARIHGFFPTAPFGKKAKFMVLQNANAMYEWAAQSAMDNYNNGVTADKLHDALEKKIADRHGAEQPGSAYESCKIDAEEVNKYLQQSADFYDGVVRKSIHKYYDFTNQQLHWYRFLLNEEQYKQLFYNVATDLMEQLDNYSRFQRLGRPDFTVTNCEKILQNPPKPQGVTEQPDGECPVKLAIPLGIGRIKMDCNGWSIEGGELLVLSMEKDYRSGEFTVGFGLGAGIDVPGMGVGGKGQVFVQFDNNLSPVDCGMVFDAGGEAVAGPVVIAEENISATIGMTSGIHIDAIHAGRQINIFEMDPGK